MTIRYNVEYRFNDFGEDMGEAFVGRVNYETNLFSAIFLCQQKKCFQARNGVIE